MSSCKVCRNPVRGEIAIKYGRLICDKCIEPFRKCYEDEPLSICAFVPFYNEKDVLPILLKSLRRFKTVICCDGKWSRFPDVTARKDGLSYDGSREIVKSFKNTILIDSGNTDEETMLNLCFQKAGELGFDLALQMGADEYVVGNPEVLTSNAKNMIIRERKFTYFVDFKTTHITPPTQKFVQLGRLHFRPEKISVKNVHWWYYVDGVRQTFGSCVQGLTIYHDDLPRSAKREQQMEDYQNENVKREAGIMGKIQ